MKGTIETLKSNFGFIRGEDGTSYFFIPSGLQLSTMGWDDLKQGMRVNFTDIVHPKGPRAIEVQVEARDGNRP